MRRTGWSRPIITLSVTVAVLVVVYALQPTHGIGVLAYPAVLARRPSPG